MAKDDADAFGSDGIVVRLSLFVFSLSAVPHYRRPLYAKHPESMVPKLMQAPREHGINALLRIKNVHSEALCSVCVSCFSFFFVPFFFFFFLKFSMALSRTQRNTHAGMHADMYACCAVTGLWLIV